jgi:hypothetical protein
MPGAGVEPATQPMVNMMTIFHLMLTVVLCLTGCAIVCAQTNQTFANYTLDYDTPLNPSLQASLGKIDADLRSKFGMTTEQTAVGVLDLNTLRLAMIHPDRGEYAASIPKPPRI